MKHAILGAGAVGGLVGAVLAHEGEDVTLLVRPENQSGYPGQLTLNTPNGSRSRRFALKQSYVADRLRHGGFTCEFQADEKTMLWSKLAFLGPFALTGTASDMDKQGIFADSAWRARLESAVGEACAVAVADGAVVDGGKILATLASLPATMRSSMQKDVSAGRMPELDAIGGLILRRGERYNLNVPVTREMAARIQDRLSTLHSASAS